MSSYVSPRNPGSVKSNIMGAEVKIEIIIRMPCPETTTITLSSTALSANFLFKAKMFSRVAFSLQRESTKIRL